MSGKSKKMAYDGKGNHVIRAEGEFKAAYERFGGGSNTYAEKWVPFIKELAVMVVRSAQGIFTYPVVETIQENNICSKVNH